MLKEQWIPVNTKKEVRNGGGGKVKEFSDLPDNHEDGYCIFLSSMEELLSIRKGRQNKHKRNAVAPFLCNDYTVWKGSQDKL